MPRKPGFFTKVKFKIPMAASSGSGSTFTLRLIDGHLWDGRSWSGRSSSEPKFDVPIFGVNRVTLFEAWLDIVVLLVILPLLFGVGRSLCLWVVTAATEAAEKAGDEGNDDDDRQDNED